MNQVSKKLSFLFILSAIFITINSCKKTFDAPPAPSDPNLTVTHTIKELKAMHTVGGALDMINSDMIIAGTVIANDKSGNLYKTIYIQDATGSIQLSLDASGLFNSYPVGRKVYVKCKGLCLSDYNNMIQLGVRATVSGTPSFQAIASNLIGQYVVGGSLNNAVPIKTVTIADLRTNMQDSLLGTLIRLEDFEFSDTTKTFADTSAYKNDLNLDIRNCTGASIIIRTSGYANFAGVKAPGGNGSVVALYTVFRTTRQLILRDTSDLQLKNSRCNLFEENFDGTITGNDINLTGWQNIAETGGIKYKSNSIAGPSNYAAVSAFQAPGNPPVVTSWLITPAINITGTSANLNFLTKDGFNNGATLTVLISTNYNGSQTPSTSTWSTLASSSANPILFAGPTNPGFAPSWKSGLINLDAYLGKKVHIAFRYDGGTGKTTTWQLDNVKISK